MAKPPSQGLLLYHLTHVDNMRSVLERGLLSRDELTIKEIIFRDIADSEIIKKREKINELSKYVPFHFYAKNPFDCAVSHSYGVKNMVLITVRRELYKEKHLSIIPSHPLDNKRPAIYPYDKGIHLINWEILDRVSGRDYKNSDIKKACMAECLIDKVVPVEDFHCIFVYDQECKNKIMEISESNTVRIIVNKNMFPSTYTD